MKKIRPANFIKKLSFFSVVIIVGILYSACNEEPTELGYSLVQDTLIVTPLTSDEVELITRYENYIYRLPTPPSRPTFNSIRLQVGKFDDFKSISFLRFGYWPDSLAHLNEDNILSAKLKMFPKQYAFGDTNSQDFGFKIYKLQRLFRLETDWDTLFPGGSEISPFIDYSREFGSFSGQVNYEYYPDSIEVDMSKDYIIEMLRMKADSNLREQMYGIALLPDENINVIRQFWGNSGYDEDSTGYLPLLTFIYQEDDAEEPDTVSITPAIDISYTDGDIPDENLLFIQGMISLRSDLWFDVSEIPPFSGIHSAILDLHYSPEFSIWGNLGPDSLAILSLAVDTLENKDIISRDYYGGMDTTMENVFRFPRLSSVVEIWNRSGGIGRLILRTQDYYEFYRMNRSAFYTPDAEDPAKRPSLKIVYSTRPDFNREGSK